jgi:NitT/TauT family transport system permease protein
MPMDEKPLGRVQVVLLRILGASLMLGLWYAIAIGSAGRVLATPDAVLARLWQGITSGELWEFFQPTGYILLLGSFIASLAGLLLGLVIGRFRRCELFLSTTINTLYVVPKVSLVPFLLLLLGFTDATKIVIVFLNAVFPIIINTAAGVRAINHDYIEMADSFSSREWQTWRDVLIPGSLPFIISGLRVGMISALLGAVVADFYAGSSGLGYLIIQYSNRFDIAGALYPIVVLALLGVAIATALKWLGKAVSPAAEKQ